MIHACLNPQSHVSTGDVRTGRKRSGHTQHRQILSKSDGMSSRVTDTDRPRITIPPLLSLGLPRPDPLEELGAAEVVPRLSLFLPHALLDHHLGGDAGVVTTRVPQHRLPPHPVPDTRHSRGLTNIIDNIFQATSHRAEWTMILVIFYLCIYSLTYVCICF